MPGSPPMTLARLIYVYSEDLSDERFKEKLSNVSAKEISRAARDRRNGHLGYAEAILIGYNRKSHNCLPWDKLYSHKAPTKKRPKSPDEPAVLPDPGLLGLDFEDDPEAPLEGETGPDTEREVLPLEMGYADDLLEGAEA